MKHSKSKQVHDSQSVAKSECLNFIGPEANLIAQSIEKAYNDNLTQLIMYDVIISVNWFNHVTHFPQLVYKLRKGSSISFSDNFLVGMPEETYRMTETKVLLAISVFKELILFTRKMIVLYNPYYMHFKLTSLKEINDLLNDWGNVNLFYDIPSFAHKYWSKQFYNDILHRVYYSDNSLDINYTGLPKILTSL